MGTAPKPNETQAEFVARYCIRLKAKAKDLAAKTAEAYAIYRKHKGADIGKDELINELMFEKSRLAGIVERLDKDDDPCWDGYEMVGTKMQDGKEVPNCVPIDD